MSANRALTWEAVWTFRLRRHSLDAPAPPKNVVEVVRAVCGIHAQVMPAAELSLGIRVAGITRREVRAELWERRRLVKTYGLRGTVHLFPADELSLWLAAFRARPARGEERRLAEMGLTLAQRDTIVAAIGEALDGCCLTREELGEELARRLGPWVTDAVSPAFGTQWPRWLITLVDAATAGVLCFGPNQGSKVTFVRPDQWLGTMSEVEGRGALLEIFRRYLAAYGPATPDDFARWFALNPGVARDLAWELAGELVEVEVEGYRASLLACDTGKFEAPALEVVHLLPHFDCYVIGCHPRDRLVPEPWRDRVVTHGSIGNRPTLLVDGMVAGLWQHRRRGKKLEIRVEAFRELTAGRRAALEAAAMRIGDVAEASPVLSSGTVDVGPHL